MLDQIVQRRDFKRFARHTGNPELLSSAPGDGPGVFDSFDAKLPNVSDLDLSAIGGVSKNFTLRASVNNVLDKDPPLVSSLLAGTAQYLPHL